MTGAITLIDSEVVAAFPEFKITTPRLGEGSSKAAYLATDNGKEFVLKILFGGEDPGPGEEAVYDQRFIREIQIMDKLDSPRIVKLRSPVAIRNIGKSSKTWYGEPHYSGGSLDKIQLNRKLKETEILTLALHLFEGLQVLEAAGIVHRDIKPGNICQTGDGNFILLDLGIAQVLSLNPLTETGTIAPLTTPYAAPEQFQYRSAIPIDSRTDMFSIGIVLFESISGRHPFSSNANSLPQYLEAINNHQPGQLEAYDAPPQIKFLIDRCLSARQNRRFRNVNQALKILNEIEAPA